MNLPKPSAMTWAAIALVLVCAAGTAWLGYELFAITSTPPEFSTQ